MLFIAPLIEELGFRLALKLNHLNLSISLGIQLVFIYIFFDFYNLNLVQKLALMLCVILLLYVLINQKVIKFIQLRYNIFLFYNILFFGLIHAPNYQYLSYTDFFFIPIIIISQIFIGAYLSFIRLKNGLKYSIFLHLLHNLILSSYL